MIEVAATHRVATGALLLQPTCPSVVEFRPDLGLTHRLLSCGLPGACCQHHDSEEDAGIIVEEFYLVVESYSPAINTPQRSAKNPGREAGDASPAVHRWQNKVTCEEKTKKDLGCRVYVRWPSHQLPSALNVGNSAGALSVTADRPATDVLDLQLAAE